MKIKFFIYFFVFFNIVYGQSDIKRIKGLIKDKVSNEPISDVLLIFNNELIGFTDSDGEFNIIYDFKESDKILIKHLCYSSIYHQLTQENFQFINLSPSVNALKEVFLGIDKEANNIIAKSSKKFKKNYRKDPYWSKSNLKQVLTYNDSLPSYLEGDFITLMLGNDRNVWNLPILVPLEVRRTKEEFNTALSKSDKDKNTQFYSNMGINYSSDAFLTSYRFFEFSHPLLRKNYFYTLEGTTIINGINCYIINYSSKKEKNNIKGRDFYSIQGQIVLEKENLSLKKITSLHRRSTHSKSNGVDNIFTITYKEIDGIIYPKTISYSIGIDYSQIKIAVEGILNFERIYTPKIDNYRNSISSNRYLFHYSDIYNIYNENYWKKKTNIKSYFEDKYFNGNIDTIDFINGSLQKIKAKLLYPGTTDNELKILKLLPKSI